MKQHSEHRGVKIYTDTKGHFTSKYGEHLTLLKCIEKIDHRLDYKPKNFWVWDDQKITFFTDEQVEELEEEYNFSNEIIKIYALHFNINGVFFFHYNFKGIIMKGEIKTPIEDDNGNPIELNEETFEFLYFEYCKEILAEDTMNDIYENYKEYLEK